MQSIETTLARPWKENANFHEHLYEWIRRAPWLTISVAAHLLIYMILAAIPWRMFVHEEPVVLQMAHEVTEEPFIEDKEEIVEPEDNDEVVDEPVLLADDAVEDDFLSTEDSTSDSSAFSDFDVMTDTLAVIGVGGGWPGGPHGGSRAPQGHGKSVLAVRLGLEWLAAHQAQDGSWRGATFDERCGRLDEATFCDGAGSPVHDVGLSGLALLAFMGAGNTMGSGEHQEVVRAGIGWLRGVQDEAGLFGDATSKEFLYSQAIATMAVCEAYYSSKSPLLRNPAQRAVNYIHRARNPYGAWRYDVPAIGDNDTSLTGWMIFALAAAKDAGLSVDPAALEGALAWIDEVSDPATGRVGYDAFGSQSSRTNVNAHFPREASETMTAVGLLSRIFLGQKPEEHAILEKHADLIARRPPEWDPDGGSCDMYYWYYGTYALYQMGDPHWKVWERAMQPAILDHQRTTGDARGSWDPVGPWGYVGGRVYSTALMTLCLQVHYRYGALLGSR